MDYHLTTWPAGVGAAQGDDSAARRLDELNEQQAAVALLALGDTAGAWAAASGDGASAWTRLCTHISADRQAGACVVSFSHFLPRLELLPEKRFLFLPTLAKAVRNPRLLQQVQQRRESDPCMFGRWGQRS